MPDEGPPTESLGMVVETVLSRQRRVDIIVSCPMGEFVDVINDKVLVKWIEFTQWFVLEHCCECVHDVIHFGCGAVGATTGDWCSPQFQAQQLSATQAITARLATIMLAPPSPRHQVRRQAEGTEWHFV